MHGITAVRKIIIPLLLTLAACATTPRKPLSCEVQQQASVKDNLRGVRYCEILFIQGAGENSTGCIYTTMGLNVCPPEEWNALNARQLRREYQVSNVILNGPRFWVMDKFAINTTSQGIDIDGLEMRPGAEIGMGRGGLIGSVLQKPYQETQILRDTVFTYLHGRPTYRLHSKDGHTYIMQAYSRIVDPTLTMPQLLTLGDKLQLPDGWTYDVVMLAEDLVLDSGGTAYVTQDNLQNTYQRMD